MQFYGLLDLSAARGTLALFPPATKQPMAGYLRLFLDIWPEEVRTFLGLFVYELRDIGSEFTHFDYHPLDGTAPVDACDIMARPIAFDEPIADAQGNSLASAYPKIQALLGDSQPFAASWSSGGTTSLSVELGQPFALCELWRGDISYKVPLSVESSDGRVRLRQDARAYLAFENGQWHDGWLEIFPLVGDGSWTGRFEAPATFAQHTGISGVNFGDWDGGFWYTELFFGRTTPAVWGDVTVEGVDQAGQVATMPIESLHW